MSKQGKQVEFYDGISELEKFLETSKLKHVNKALRIQKISSISKLFFYLGITGIILCIISIFILNAWIFCWIYALVIIIFMGFIFTKPGKKFNFIFIIGIFALLAFLPSIYGQSVLNILSADPGGDFGGSVGGNVVVIYLSDMEELIQRLEPFEGYLKDEYTIEDVIHALRGVKTKDLTEFTKYGGDYSLFFKSDAWSPKPIGQPNSSRIFKSKLAIALRDAYNYIQENDLSIESPGIGAFLDALDQLTENPFKDLPEYMINFTDVLNWIVFIAIIAYSGSIIGDLISFQWEKIGKKVAFIALAITIMTLIYTMFNLAEVEVRTVWATVGSAWKIMLKKVGLASLDQAGNASVSVKSVTNGLFSWVPLIITLAMFGLAFAFRKSDFKSILFTRDITEENTISVEASKFSVSVAVLLFVMGIYVVGYFLITAEPTVTINPLITLIFYLFSIVVLILIGFKVLILNKKIAIPSFLFKTLKWTVLGLFGLFLWFQVFQPVAYDLNLIDTSTGLLTLSQDTIFENNSLEQLFLVAAPETLIFQIFPIGLGNRVYFFFRRTRILKDEEKRLKLERWKIAEQYRNIKISPNSVSRENLRKIAKLTVLKQKYDVITETLDRNKIQKVPYRFFIIPTIISGLLGSFIFSWYHSFRRGISFIIWWQNPMLGMVYFGAGFFLCFIAFFSFPAAILVHGFNNIIALMLAGVV